MQAYPSANDFLDAYRPDYSGYLLLDIDMPDTDGLKLQEMLAKMQLSIPIIFLTGKADVPKTIQAFRRGAFDLLQKPATAETLLECINEALAQDFRERTEEMKRSPIQERVECLKPREREVMLLLVSEYSNKQMAHELKISFRTIEGHRRHVYEKMNTSSYANLIEMARLAGLN